MHLTETSLLSRRIEKLMVICFSFCFLMVCTFNAQAQGKKISVDCRNMNLSTALNKIEQMSDFRFNFNYEELSQYPVNVAIKNKTAPEAVDILLQGKPLKMTVKNKFISISRERRVMQGPQTQQDKSKKKYRIHGNVSDQNSNPLPGVNVVVQGTKYGTITNADGSYSIVVDNDQADASVLTFSFIGMKTTTKNLKSKNSDQEINVMMLENASQLGEVLVTGFQTIERGRATGSYNIINQKDLKIIPSNNFVQKLEGLVPGLLLKTDGTLQMRGKATLYANSQPLIVVDGFPMEYDSYNINPNDIEQISVLKDAASASIWGVRAANGVIVITTKSGRRNEGLSISYNGMIKMTAMKDLASFHRMNPKQLWDANYELYKQGYIIDENNPYPIYDEGGKLYYQLKTKAISQKDFESKVADLISYDNLNDIKKFFYRRPVLQQHNLVLTNSGQRSSTYLSVNYEHETLEAKDNSENKIGFQFNHNADFFKWMKVEVGVRGNFFRQHLNPNSEGLMTGTQAINPWVRFFDENGGYVNELGVAGTSEMEQNYYVTKYGLRNWSFNRVQEMNEYKGRTQTQNIASHVKLEIQLPWSMKFTTSGMYIFENMNAYSDFSPNSWTVRDYINRYTKINTDTGAKVQQFPNGAIHNTSHSFSDSYNWRNVIEFNKSLTNVSVMAQAGFEMFAVRTKSEQAHYYGYDSQSLNYDYNVTDSYLNSGLAGYNGKYQSTGTVYPKIGDVENRYFSTFGIGSVQLYDRYTLFGSIRYDQTNLYGRGKKYRDQPTWALGLKWDISKEAFFHSKTIDMLSFKMSYGLSGNVDKSTSPYLIAYNVKNLMFNLNGLYIANPANPSLKWEKVYTWNMGVDMNMLQNRLRFSVEYYNRKTNNALGRSETAPSSGWESLLLNTASIQNRGIDLSVSATPIETKNFVWDSHFTLSYNHNKVTRVLSGNPTITSIVGGLPLMGKPIDYIYSFKYAGLDETGDPMLYNGNGEKVKWSAISSFKLSDIAFSGRKTPPYFGAWNNNFTFHGVSLNVLLTYQLGHKMRMQTISTDAYGLYRSNDELDNRWRTAGDENKTKIPLLQYSSSGNRSIAFNNSDYRTESASVIRLRTISCSYDFKRFIKNDHVQNLNVTFAADNLLKWTKNSKHLDPENLTEGVYKGDLQPVYSISLNVTLK